MIYFLDIKFIETDAFPDLVSIALVSNDGREYYAVLSEEKTRKAIRKEIEKFIGKEYIVEIWANFATYYFVVFIQLWGSLFDLPKNVRMYELQQYLLNRGESVPEQIPPCFNALESARWVRKMYSEYVQGTRPGHEYRFGDVVDINHPMRTVLGTNRYRGIGVVEGFADGNKEFLVVNLICENGERTVFRVALHYTSLHLLYRR